MPASITIDLVASSPKVAGSRMLMPDERPDAGQHADEGADQAAEKGVPQHVGLERDRETEQQAVEAVPIAQNPRTPGSSGDLSRRANSR